MRSEMDCRVERLEEAERILTSLYWEMKDNKDELKYSSRLDTILGKLYTLKVMMRGKGV